MEDLIKQKRVKFSNQMSQNYDSGDGEFATSIAAAAFAIYSLDETSRKECGLEAFRTKIKNRNEDTTNGMPASSKISRRLSGKEAKNPGEASMRMSIGQNHKAPEIASPTNKSSHPASTRPTSPAAGKEKQNQNLTRRENVETKADAWERAEMEKIKKWYEKMKSRIVAWENEKKMRAKLRLEKEKIELEHIRARNFQHHQVKIARINETVGGAKTQVEERRRNKESAVKEKAKKIRTTGKVPAVCLCF